jgi:hypothetical protein
LRCPHFAHVTIGASINKLDTDNNESSAPASM